MNPDICGSDGWRGEQPAAAREEALAWAERLQTSVYRCRVCDWVQAQDGCAYDALLNVCGACAGRIMNLHHRQHGGEWFARDRATDADLRHFGEDREPPQRAPAPRGKAKVSNALRFKVYERDGFKCVYCGSRNDLTLDHVTAEANGGATEEGNLVTACRQCNCRKKTKSLADFWEERV